MSPLRRWTCYRNKLKGNSTFPQSKLKTKTIRTRWRKTRIWTFKLDRRSNCRTWDLTITPFVAAANSSPLSPVTWTQHRKTLVICRRLSTRRIKPHYLALQEWGEPTSPKSAAVVSYRRRNKTNNNSPQMSNNHCHLNQWWWKINCDKLWELEKPVVKE